MSDQANMTTLQEEGLAWVERMTSGFASQDDAAALARWRNQSKAHAAALRRAIQLRRACRHLARERVAQAAARQDVRQSRVVRRIALGTTLAIFAGAAAWAAVDPPMGLWPSIADVAADYRTGKGEQRQIDFGHALRVNLNTLTSLSEKRGTKTPGLRLVDGEITVSPLPAAAQTYAVYVKEMTIIPRQGAINVRSDSNGIAVTAIDGEAEITFDGHSLVIAPHQQIRVVDGMMRAPAFVDIAPVVAWRQDLLLLRNSSLAAAVQEINRYRPGLIVIGSSRLASRRINAVLQLNDISQSLDLICRLTGAHTTAIGDYIVLS